MTGQGALEVAWDVWRAGRGGPGAIGARQRARLQEIVAFARANSRVYADHYRSVPGPVTEAAALPPITKQALMDRFGEWVTDPEITRAGAEAFLRDPSRVGEYYLGRYLLWTTSGSTGTPAILLCDKDALAVLNGIGYARGLAGALSARDFIEVLRRGARAAAVFATGGHFLGATMMVRRQRDLPWRKKTQRIFSALDPLPRLVTELNAYQPSLLGGYASALSLLAREQEAGRLSVHPVLISSSGETLTPAARARIRAAFGCPVTDTYSASEAPGLALECREQWQHVNADWYILEPVDEGYRPTPPGQPSRSVLVTNLVNRIQPILRYELGDSVTVRPDPCPCGSPLPAIRVTGRTDETLNLTGMDGRTVTILALALGAVIEETPGVNRFQAIQTAAARIDLRLEARAGEETARVARAVERRLRVYLESQGLSGVDIRYSSEPPKLHPRSGKLRQVLVALE